MEGISLTPQMMCEECDAFLGKAHKQSCSKYGRLVENADAVEKMALTEEVERQNPLLGIDPHAAELILKNLGESEHPGEIEELKSLKEGLETFVAAAREAEQGGNDADAGS
jgi:hypothetical protein